MRPVAASATVSCRRCRTCTSSRRPSSIVCSRPTSSADARLALVADACRLNALVAVKRAGSGHLGSTFSALDIVAQLLFDELDVAERGFDDPDRDVFFSSKGHDVPGLYAALFALGVVPRERLLRLRRLDGLDGHPDVGVPGIEASSGSLGMGISKGRGIALAKRHLGREGLVVVMTGDGELQEGQNWEALQAAAHERLGRLWVVVDRNEVQSDKPTEEIVALGDLEAKLRAFGWEVETADGHDHAALRAAFGRFRAGGDAPKALVAQTVKGKGVSFMEHPAALAEGGGTYRWHAGAPADEPFARAVAELEARLAERCAALGLDPPALEPVETEAAGRRPRGRARVRAPAAARSRSESPRIGGVRRRGLRRDAARAGGRACRPRRARRRPRLRLPHPGVRARVSRIASSSAGSPSRTWSRRRRAWHATGCCRSSTRSPRSSPRARTSRSTTRRARARRSSTRSTTPGSSRPGPGKSHQSVRDISLLAALPNVAIVQPGSWDEARGLRALGRARTRTRPSRCASRSAPRRGGSSFPRDRRIGRGSVLRDGGDAVLLAVRPRDAPRGAPRGRATWRRAGSCRCGSSRCRGSTASTRTGSPPRSPRSSTSSSSRTTRRSAAWATASAPRFRAASSRSSASRAGPRAGRPTRRSGSTASTARRSRRGSPRPRSPRRESRLVRRSMTKRAWVVLPDLLSIRVFFDTGIVSGLHERLDGRLAAVFLVPRDAAAEWLDRAARRSTCSHGDDLTTGHGLPDRALARVDASLDRQLGYHPLAIRLNRRHGFHTERMQPGHPNWMLDTNRDSRLPHRPAVERAMERWFFSPRRHVPRRLLEAMRRDCSGLVLSNVQPMNAVPFLTAARRLRLPVVAHVASWDHTVGKGVISPHCDLYVVQNRVMEDDLRRYHGIAPERVRVTGWPQTDLFHRVRPRAEYDALAAPLRARSRRPLVARRREHAEQRAVRGALRRASRRVVGSQALARAACSFSSGPTRATARWQERFAAAAGHDGIVRAGGELLGPRGSRDAAPARGRRRLQRGDDPARRARGRPAGRLRPLRRGSAARASRGRRRTSSASTTRSSRPPAPSIGPSASRRSSPGIERALERPDELAGQRRRAVEQVVGVVDGRAAERVVDAVASMFGDDAP